MKRKLIFISLMIGVVSQLVWAQSVVDYFIWPVHGKDDGAVAFHSDQLDDIGYYIFQYFGRPEDGYHDGLDINAIGRDDLNDDVIAVADGIVVASEFDNGFGNLVRIKHYTPWGDVYSQVGHLSQRLVSKDNVVKQGQLIGKLGSTGNSTGPHIHYSLLKQNITGEGYYDHPVSSDTHYDPLVFTNSHAPAQYTNNGYTCYGPMYSDANWNFYGSSGPLSMFTVNEHVHGIFKIEKIMKRHRFQYVISYKQNGSWIEKSRGQTAYNEVSPASPWEWAYFFPEISNMNIAGDWRVEAYLDIGQGFLSIDKVYFKVNPPAKYYYSGNAYVGTGPMNYFTNWNYYAVAKRTSFRKGDTAYAVAKIINVTQTHRFHVDFYRNGLKQGTGWDTAWNTVNGKWDKAYFFPSWYNLPSGNCQMKLYVDFGEGREFLDTLSFSVSTNATPYVYYPQDMEGNYTSYMCKGPVTGGSNTDWVYKGPRATTFRTTDIPTAVVMINDIKVRHRFKVVGYVNDNHNWEYPMTSWNEVSSTSPWKWSFFCPEWRNPPVGNLRMEIYVDTGSGFPSLPVKKLSFTVTN